jgi:hypothetical protein
MRHRYSVRASGRSGWAAALFAVPLATAMISGPLAGPAGAAATQKPQHNSSFAGYEVQKTKGKVTSASTTFVVPTITCKKSYSGVGPAVLINTKPNKKNVYTYSGAGVAVTCQNKVPDYQAVVIVNASEDNDFTVTPGDKINVTVHMSSSKTKVEADDVTSGMTATKKGHGKTGETALIGDASIAFGKTTVGIDPFTKTSFTDGQVDNKNLGHEKAFPVERTHGSTVQIAVSKLKHGKDFILTFKNSK